VVNPIFSARSHNPNRILEFWDYKMLSPEFQDWEKQSRIAMPRNMSKSWSLVKVSPSPGLNLQSEFKWNDAVDFSCVCGLDLSTASLPVTESVWKVEGILFIACAMCEQHYQEHLSTWRQFMSARRRPISTGSAAVTTQLSRTPSDISGDSCRASRVLR